MTRDDVYSIFTSGQHKHDCPGFDCVECSHCFNLVFEAITQQSEVRISLNRERLARLLYAQEAKKDVYYYQDIIFEQVQDVYLEEADAILTDLKELLEVNDEKSI